MGKTKERKGSVADVIATLCLLFLTTLVAFFENASCGMPALFYFASIGGLFVSTMCFCDRWKKSGVSLFWTICVGIFVSYCLHFWQPEHAFLWKTAIVTVYLVLINYIASWDR